MGIGTRIRRGEGPLFGPAKRVAAAILCFHLPSVGPFRPIFRSLYLAHVCLREAWNYALRFFWYEPLFRSQCRRVGRAFKMEKLPYIVGSGSIVIGSNVRLSGKQSIGFNNRGAHEPELEIGDGTFIGHGCSFQVARSVRIERNCLIAGGVRIQDHDGHPIDARQRRNGEPSPQDRIKPVAVGEDVWIGSEALILKGVRIGDRAIVAARSVVTVDVEPDSVVAGNPAKMVKRLVAAEARTGRTAE